jgi:hypothetical protein
MINEGQFHGGGGKSPDVENAAASVGLGCLALIFVALLAMAWAVSFIG